MIVKYAGIDSVEPLKNMWLKVRFEGDVVKYYDCSRLLSPSTFSLLEKEWFLKTVRRDSGGYGVSWNDQVDLAESELWVHGTSVAPAGV